MTPHSPDLIHKVLKYRASGMTLRQIALLLGRSTKTIQQIIKEAK